MQTLECPRQGVSRANLVISICTNQQQMTHVRLRQQILDQIERSGVKPLQIVKEHCERMFRSSEDADKPAKYELETNLRFLRRQLRNRCLFPDDELQFRNEVSNE